MNITDIKVRRVYNIGRLRGVVSIVLDDAIAIHDIKVIEGPERLFVAMPSRKEETGYRDIVHPITADMRKLLEDAVISAYEEALRLTLTNLQKPSDDATEEPTQVAEPEELTF